MPPPSPETRRGRTKRGMLSRLSTATGQGFSAGVAGAGPDSTVEDLLRLADGGCCHAKQTGRGGVGVADGALDSVVL